MLKKILHIIVGLLAVSYLSAQNPYLPLWEFIPDGEPYVFEDPDNPGRYRVYIYGSHDLLRTAYCGYDQVVWSAPVDTLTAWRYDGEFGLHSSNYTLLLRISPSTFSRRA